MRLGAPEELRARKLLGGRGVAVLHDWVEAPQRDLRDATLRQWPPPPSRHLGPAGCAKVASAEENRAFVADYEEAAGRRLDHERADAARTYVIATAAAASCPTSPAGEGDFQRELRQAAR